VKLNLGCGTDIREGWVNVDRVQLSGVDVVADLDVAPWDWAPVCGVERIDAWHVFEHVTDPALFMVSAWRALQTGGLLDIRVPWFGHPNAFTDPTHRRFCTENTFDYWIRGTALHEVHGPGYGSPPVVYVLHERELLGAARDELHVALFKVSGSIPD
jgi:hypothetical protein